MPLGDSNARCLVISHRGSAVIPVKGIFYLVISHVGGPCGISICPSGYSCKDGQWETKWHMVKHDNWTIETQNESVHDFSYQVLTINDDIFYPNEDQLYCKQNSATKVTCNSCWDGDCSGICSLGQSCMIYTVEDGKVKYEAKDHWKKTYESEMIDYNVTEKNSLAVSG